MLGLRQHRMTFLMRHPLHSNMWPSKGVGTIGMQNEEQNLLERFVLPSSGVISKSGECR